MKTYKNLVDYLLLVGFKRVDMTADGDEIFQLKKLKFAIREVK